MRYLWRRMRARRKIETLGVGDSVYGRIISRMEPFGRGFVVTYQDGRQQGFRHDQRVRP